MTAIRKGKRFKLPLYHILLGLTLLYFLGFSSWMVFLSGQPDQAPHLYYSRRYSENWGLPEEDPNSQYVTTGQPFLYYWINGAVYKIYDSLFSNGNPISDVLLWRFLSVIYASLTVFFLYQLSTKVTGNPYLGVVTAFMLSNTLMFVFISGSVSYDNLMILAATASLFHLVCIFQNEDFIKHTALTGLWVVIGSLAKEQFLLLTTLIFLAWVYYAVKNRRKITLTFSRGKILLCILLLIAIGVFIALYGTNLIRYGKTLPACKQVKAEDLCYRYALRRDFSEPINLQWLWYNRDNIPNPITYALSYWGLRMLESIWGILSHNTFVPQLAVGLHAVAILWGAICAFRFWKASETTPNLLIFILISYAGFFLFWHYKKEIDLSFQHYAVTGRYLLPIVGILQTLMLYYFTKLKSALLMRLTLALIILLYFSGGLWMFLTRYPLVFAHWQAIH